MTTSTFDARKLELLVSESAAGNAESFGELYDALYDRVISYVFKRTYDVAASEDIVSNIFYKIMSSLGKFRWRDEAGWYAWVFRIARNEIVTYARVGAKTTQVDDWSEYDEKSRSLDSDALEVAETNEQSETLKKFVTALRPKYREPIELYYFAGLGHEEIARVLGISPGNARVRLHRALEMLQQSMKGDGYEY